MVKNNILKKTILFFVFILSISVGIFAEENKSTDKYTTVNIMLRRIYTASEGVILEYFAGDKMRWTYLPNSFFERGLAVRIFEENTAIAPQANVVYKNGQAHKVKIYLPRIQSGFSYRILEYLTPAQREGFKTNKLVFTLRDEDKSKGQ